MFVIFYVADPVNSGSGKYIDLMTIKMWKKPNSSEILKWLLFLFLMPSALKWVVTWLCFFNFYKICFFFGFFGKMLGPKKWGRHP